MKWVQGYYYGEDIFAHIPILKEAMAQGKKVHKILEDYVNGVGDYGEYPNPLEIINEIDPDSKSIISEQEFLVDLPGIPLKLKGFMDVTTDNTVIDYKNRYISPKRIKEGTLPAWNGQKKLETNYWIQSNLYAYAFYELNKKRAKHVKFVEIRGGEYKIRDMDISRVDEVLELCKKLYKYEYEQ